MNKKIKLILPTITIIILLTLLSTFTCTYLMKRIKAKEFASAVSVYFHDINANLALNDNPKGSKREQSSYKYGMDLHLDGSSSGWERDDGYFDYVAVVYDYTFEKTVVSDCRIVVDEDLTIHLSDYLSREEILAHAEEIQKCIYGYHGMFKVALDSDGNPVFITAKWTPQQNKIILNENGTAVRYVDAIGYFPKRMEDEEKWMKKFTGWMNNELLQNELQKAKDRVKDVDYYSYNSDSLIIIEQPLFDKFIENNKLKYEPFCNLILIATYHPWLAAIKELKSIYLLITAISVLCIWSISKNIIDTYDKQKSLEESKSSFIAAMAHDLKTPLTVIKGYSENLLDEGNDKNREYLQKIIGKTDEIDDMVSKMLDISKLDSGGFEIERKEVLLNDILNQAIVKYLPIMEQRSLEYTINEKNQFYLIGDERYLEQMINNLIDNAVSYAETDSDIEIEIDQNSLSVWNKSDPLSAEQQKHLFELSSGSNGHHGFGLYFAKKIADIHDLALKYGYSDDGVCFTVNKL